MSKMRFATLACVAVSAGVSAAVLVMPRQPVQPRVLQATWAARYQTVPQMSRDVDAVVLVSVLSTLPGRAVPTAGGVLPFTLVDLRVEQAIRGRIQTGESVTLEQTGGELDGRSVYLADDGGPYAAGARALLFLKQQSTTGFYYLVHPQGRYRVEGGRLFAVAPDDPVAQQLDRRSVTDAVRLILE